MRIHGVVVRRLLDLTRRAAAHGEPAPGKYALMSLECHELLGLLIERNSPESVHCVQLQEVTLAV